MNSRKMHTTNYQNTFIEIAEDCPARAGEVPQVKGAKRTAAVIQFEMIRESPYKYTSDDVLFQVYADRNNLKKEELPAAREQFFSKGQPCFRASPLPKRYGWGVHSNEEGKIAIFGCETTEYKRLSSDRDVKVVRAMRSSR